MKFFGTPGMLVRINKNKAKPKNLKSFRFDANGEFETENIRLINALKKRFKFEEQKINLEKSVKEISQGENIKHCKKCEFTCETHGELLKHYKSEHSKEG